jgi:hypothetical protein
MTAAAAYGQTTRPVEIVTVCQVLSDRASFNGEYVAVIGQLAAGGEGRWIVDQCEKPTKTNSYVWSDMISLEFDPQAATARPPEFAIDLDEVEKKIGELKLRIKRTKDLEWGLVYGRIVTQEYLQTTTRRDGSVIPDGFGHLGASPAKIVYRQKDLKTIPVKK